MQVVIKFFALQQRFQHERTFYETRAALDGEAKWQAVPQLKAAFAGPASIETGSDAPASLVLEAGEFTMQVSRPAAAVQAAGTGNVHAVCLLHNQLICSGNRSVAASSSSQRQGSSARAEYMAYSRNLTIHTCLSWLTDLAVSSCKAGQLVASCNV